jgi:pyruvate kinase
MVDNPQPSSAEVADITNAVLDGCDAILLTGETAYGLHPLQTINTCRKVILEAERCWRPPVVSMPQSASMDEVLAFSAV